MFSLPRSYDLYFSHGVHPVENGSEYIFPGLSGNEIVIHIPEKEAAINLYYFSDVRNRERRLTINWVNTINKFAATWDHIIALSKLLGDIPGVEETIWYHIAEWLTHAPKSSFNITYVADP